MADHAQLVGPALRRRSVLTTAIAALVGITVLLTGAPAAHAEPSVSQIEKQLDEAWNQLEPVIERHNATSQELKQKKKLADELAKKIAPLQLQIDVALARVGAFAVEQYKGGRVSALNAILTSGSPQTFTDQLELLDQFARTSQGNIKTVVDLREKYAAEKKPLDALVSQLTMTESQLATKTTQINTEIKRLDKLRLAAYGAGGTVGDLAPAPCPVTYPGGAAGTAVRFACAQIGKTYVWGAEGPDHFDCSGLTLAAWKKAGVSLPHNAAAQRRQIKSVSRAELRAGDLVFYYSDVHHVGMYVGGGWIVHASREGEPIRMRKIDAAPIHSYGRPA